MDAPGIDLATVVLDCRDANALADFYSRLLGWAVTYREDDWVLMRNPHGGTGLSFQSEPWYEPPVWPEKDGHPAKMVHLDLWVDDLSGAVEHAFAAGAALAEFQPQDDVRVLFDPAGHPFCLFLDRRKRVPTADQRCHVAENTRSYRASATGGDPRILIGQVRSATRCGTDRARRSSVVTSFAPMLSVVAT